MRASERALNVVVLGWIERNHNVGVAFVFDLVGMTRRHDDTAGPKRARSIERLVAVNDDEIRIARRSRGDRAPKFAQRFEKAERGCERARSLNRLHAFV